MLERTIVATIIFGLLAFDLRARYRRFGRAETTVYAVAALFALYCAGDYIAGNRWPNLDDLVQAWLIPPARAIDALLRT